MHLLIKKRMVLIKLWRGFHLADQRGMKKKIHLSKCIGNVETKIKPSSFNEKILIFQIEKS